MDNEGLYFGPQVTGCLLEWEWMVAKRYDASAFEFLDRIYKLEATVGEMSLDTETLTSFILGLDEADQIDISQGLIEHRQSPQWADALRSIHSAWFVIYQELTRKWDRSRYIESCRTNISRNWELARPILKDLRSQKAFDEAIPVIEAAVRALLHLRESEMWDPREELLIAHPVMRHRSEMAPSPVPLLEGWRKVAEALGQDEVAGALKLQVITYRKWADWDVVLSAFRQVTSPGLASLGGRLFASWRSLKVNSNYECSADWLAAVLELNTRSYEQIVSEWVATHRRRRNLWKALAKKNLPVRESP